MKYATVSAGILIAFAIVGLIAYRLFKPKSDKAGGFRDWVKNPDYKQAAADYLAARNALKVPDDLSDDEIQQMVDRLFVQEDEDFNFDRLKLVGQKAVPMLIAAIENPKTGSTQFGDGGHALDAKSPFARIVNLLEPVSSAETALPLAKYIDHKDDHFRKTAAMALGNIGTNECIRPMLKALDDPDDYVRSYAMMGIQRGLNAQRCTREFLDAMFPALTRLLNRDGSSTSGRAPALLLSIDTDRAMPVLLSPEYFSIENKEVHYIIKALNAAGHKIPHSTLLPFLKAVEPLIDKYPYAYDYSAALIAYALNPDASAEETFRTELKSSNGKVQEAAAEALAVLSGVTNARKVVFDAVDNLGFDHLTLPQKHYFAVTIYDGEVNNGGHSQYFVNSSGDHWRLALEGLRAIGAGARAEILHDASALFGATGPSVDNDPRHRQLAGFTEHEDKLIDKLDSRYYSCDENIHSLLDQYALKNKEHFTAKK